MTQIYDLSDPAKPVFIRDFGLPGQQPGSTGPGADRPARTDLHRAERQPRVFRLRHRRATASLQIVDRNKLLNGPKEPTDANLIYPQVAGVDLPAGRRRAHGVPDARHAAAGVRESEAAARHRRRPPASSTTTTTPRQPGRRRGATSSRSSASRSPTSASRTGRWCGWWTSRSRSKPFGVSTWTVPEASGDFCGRGGRFGTHSSNENMTPIYYNRVLFVAHFNAGVRALDVRDPFNPKEIGYYIPADHRRRPTSAASARARTSAARWRFRPTTSTWTTAGTSTSPIAPTPACTSSSSPGRRATQKVAVHFRHTQGR